jgi:hypothetical protein
MRRPYFSDERNLCFSFEKNLSNGGSVRLLSAKVDGGDH